MRSKKDHSAQAERSEPSPKENKPSPRKQVQGNHERKEMAGLRGMKPKKKKKEKKHQEGKETHGKRSKKIVRILSNHQEVRILPGA